MSLMEIDVNKAMEQLASAFNTTVEQLYPILVRQAYIDGVTSVLIAVVAWILFFILYRSTMKKKAASKYWDWFDEQSGGIRLAGIVVTGLIAFIATGIMISIAPTALFNPEYWAIKEVLISINLQ